MYLFSFSAHITQGFIICLFSAPFLFVFVTCFRKFPSDPKRKYIYLSLVLQSTQCFGFFGLLQSKFNAVRDEKNGNKYKIYIYSIQQLANLWTLRFYSVKIAVYVIGTVISKFQMCHFYLLIGCYPFWINLCCFFFSLWRIQRLTIVYYLWHLLL